MIKNFFAAIGLIVIARKAYQHFINFRNLQYENAYLRRRKKEALRDTNL